MLGLALASVAPALAAEGTPEPSGERNGRRLEFAFKKLNRWLEVQAKHLERVGNATTKVQELIDRAKPRAKM